MGPIGSSWAGVSSRPRRLLSGTTTPIRIVDGRRIVVAPLRFDATSFKVGGRSVPAEQVAEALRQQVLTALTETGRFTVLDRDLGGEVDQELERIASGQAPRAEFGKLGQAMSADVVWGGPHPCLCVRPACTPAREQQP